MTARLIITRRIAAQGRGSAHVNGLPVTISTLRKAGGMPGRHPRPARGTGAARPGATARPAGRLWRARRETRGLLAGSAETRELRRQRQALLEAVESRERERALLEYERDELAAADPKPGEYSELAREANLLRNAGHIRSTASAGYSLLYEADRSAQDILTQVARSLEPLSEAATELGSAVSDARAARR